MSEELFKVILKGYAPGKGEYYIESDLAKLFKLSEAEAKELLKSAPSVIKTNLPADQAGLYKAKIEEAGALCELESMKYNISGLSLE